MKFFPFQLQKIPKWALVLSVIIIVYFTCANTEKFHSYYSRHPYNAPQAAHPFIDPHHVRPGGDLVLTNLYRKLHNIDNTMRVDVFNHLHHPGSGEGSDSIFYTGEWMDREMSKIKSQIREDIAARRRPYAEPYWNQVPTKPLGGNFYECHLGDCQWDLDDDGKILGIPSVPGVRHAYH